MMQPAEGFCFDPESMEEPRIGGGVVLDHFRGKDPTEADVQDLVDDSHSAGTDSPLDPVLAVQEVARDQAILVSEGRGRVHCSEIGETSPAPTRAAQ